MLVDCATCHGSQSLTIGGGPHGMHPVGQSWVSSHGDAADDGRAAQCQACHGTDYRGTVLSRAQGDRTISAFGSKLFWKGFQVGCYTCHNGPGSESTTANPPATVGNASATTAGGTPVTIPLSATDPHGNPLTLRVVSQPANGTTGLTGTQATYYPDASFSGTDTFTFAAWNGSTDSNLGTVTVTVGGGATCTVTAQATVPSTGTVGQSLAFQGSATSQGCSNPVSYAWTFGDGSSSTQQNPTHAYAAANTYTWTLSVTSGSSTNSTSGTVTVTTAPSCTVTANGDRPDLRHRGLVDPVPGVGDNAGVHRHARLRVDVRRRRQLLAAEPDARLRRRQHLHLALDGLGGREQQQRDRHDHRGQRASVLAVHHRDRSDLGLRGAVGVVPAHRQGQRLPGFDQLPLDVRRRLGRLDARRSRPTRTAHPGPTRGSSGRASARRSATATGKITVSYRPRREL